MTLHQLIHGHKKEPIYAYKVSNGIKSLSGIEPGCGRCLYKSGEKE